MHWVQETAGGEVAWDVPVRPDASPLSVTVLNGSGSAFSSPTCTLDSVNTTIVSGANSPGARTLVVADGTGIVPGRTYRIDGGASGMTERVKVKTVSGVNVTLWYPTTQPHASGVAFQSTRLSCTVAAPTPASDNWRAVFTYSVAAVVQPTQEVLFGVSKHYWRNPIAEYPGALLDIDPNLYKKVPADMDWITLGQRAFDELCHTLSSGSVKIHDYIGNAHFANAVCHQALYLCSLGYGPEYANERVMWANRVEMLLRDFVQTTPVDENRDGRVSPHEVSGIFGGVLRRTR